MSASITPLILSGGSGTRLWPLSRAGYPKQFLPLAGSHSLIQQTIGRVRGERFSNPLIICNEAHRFILAEQMRAVACQPSAIVLEPQGRNTAPAIAVAALWLMAERPDDLLLVLPSDHVVLDRAAFAAAIGAGIAPAIEDRLVTFGITPDRPETGFGYIQLGDAETSWPRVHGVERFVEKPDHDTALGYVASGRHVWNAGLFLFSPAAILAELERYQPGLVDACRASLVLARNDLDFCRLDADAFAAAPAISIDYAVMEHTARAVVVPVSMGWSDLGSFAALFEVSDKDRDDNVMIGTVIADDCNDSYLRADGDQLLAVLGLSDVVVVVTDDAVLVADRAKTQNVKRIVDQLAARGRSEHLSHRQVHRPWGYYRPVDRGPGFQVKRLMVNPGEGISLQLHHHRAEHWVVVSGIARVTLGDRQFDLAQNQSIYVPAKTRHRLENPGDQPLHIIEVQTGAYLGEDDIVRFDDRYGRLGDGATETGGGNG